MIFFGRWPLFNKILFSGNPFLLESWYRGTKLYKNFHRIRWRTFEPNCPRLGPDLQCCATNVQWITFHWWDSKSCFHIASLKTRGRVIQSANTGCVTYTKLYKLALIKCWRISPLIVGQMTAKNKQDFYGNRLQRNVKHQ